MYRKAPGLVPQKLRNYYGYSIAQDPDKGVVFSQIIARYLLAPMRHPRATQRQNRY